MCLVTSNVIFIQIFGRNEGNKRHFNREKKFVTLELFPSSLMVDNYIYIFHISFFFLIKSRNMHYHSEFIAS